MTLKHFTGGPVRVKVFNPAPADMPNIFRTLPGEAQLEIDEEWDGRDNWTPDEMRAAAKALTAAADHAESLIGGTS